MAQKSILDVGPSTMPDKRATNGGCMCPPKELPYDPPKGPKGQYAGGVGLGHGSTNHGNTGTQGRH